MKKKLILNFKSHLNSYTLTFEDDGKVAYAYLKKENICVGDVWLYNRCQAPTSPEWNDPNNIPFANPKKYIVENSRMTKNVTMNDVLVSWEEDIQGLVAYIYIFEDLYGVVGINDKPGYARFASKDGPLAKVMDIE